MKGTLILVKVVFSRTGGDSGSLELEPVFFLDQSQSLESESGKFGLTPPWVQELCSSSGARVI